MSYQALLFCPDEKTARVVSQVLSELEFNVEPCHEPFAAVKKLMVQHFDAIVVDCDNEQNAALLFKSARNSGSNQASLAVAVVEGQAGVAKAFRLGANLVLTKPIHVEQSKGTLRVARGLLRKGQAAKPARQLAPSGIAVAQQCSPSAPSISAPSFPAPFTSRLRHPRSSHRKIRARRRHRQRFRIRARCGTRPRPILRTPPCSSTCRTPRFPAPIIRRGQRQNPTRRNSIPGNRASPWRSRWRPPCAGPRKLRENPSLTLTPSPAALNALRFDTGCFDRVDVEDGRRCRASPRQGNSGSRAGVSGLKPAVKTPLIPPGLAEPGLAEPKISQPEIAKTTGPVGEGSWDSNPATPRRGAPVFLSTRMRAGSFRWGRQQEDPADRGRAAWTRGRRVFRLDQNAVRAPPTGAAISCSGNSGRPRCRHRLRPQPRDSSGTGCGVAQARNSLWARRFRSFFLKPSAAVIAEVPGVKTSIPAKAPPARMMITVVKAPATAKTEPEP